LVARRTALNVQTGVRSRRELEHRLPTVIQPKETEGDANRTELYKALDEELAGLPERWRVPLVLCYLENKSQVEAARTMGCARNALQKRLAKGEAALRERLERRGLTLGALSVAAILGDTGSVLPVPGRLIESTARAAVAFRSGTLTSASAEAAEKLLRS